MVGLGGIYAEIFRDTQLATAPIGLDQAMAMIEKLRGYPLLAGARGGKKADISALARMVVQVSEIASAEGLESLDINPVAVFPEGSGCMALDATVSTREPPTPRES